MKSGAPKTAGGESILARNSYSKLALAALAILATGFASGQSLYKYRGDNGEWIYTDRPPAGGKAAEVRTIKSHSTRAAVSVTHRLTGNNIVLEADNSFFAPVEIAVVFDSIQGAEFPDPDRELRWVLAPRSKRTLLSLPALDDAKVPSVSYRFAYLPGDPGSRHHAREGYRAPFSAGNNFPVTQAYPAAVTHDTPDSEHAIDIAMPIGTDVLAARGGIVFEVAGHNFKGGINRAENAHSANFVRILHNDGTYAVYAHLNWDSVRVRPGDYVVAGQYIADSGNTGFSSGPHLHFAVQRNAGMQILSLPVEFRGPMSTGVVPATGSVLTAYP